MTTTEASAPPTHSSLRQVASPAKLAGSAAQLAFMGTIGTVAFTILVTLLTAGLGLLLVGVGLVLLLGFIYALYGAAWLETLRVEGLYGLGLPRLDPRRGSRGGFVGFLQTVGLQAIHVRMWLALATATIATFFGWLVLSFVVMASSGVAMAFAPLYADEGSAVRLVGTGWLVPTAVAPVAGIGAAVLALALIGGLALLHGIIVRAILTPSRAAVLAEQARTSQHQRAGAVRAADLDRTRIERDLHDGVQPRLVSVGMTLGMAQQKIDSDPQAAKELVSEAHASTKAAVTELRQLARGIHTSIIDDRGLDAALSALAARSPVPTTLDVRLNGRCSRPAEATVYFVISESLTNAAKHSRAAGARVLVRRREEGMLWARIEDDGIGGAHIVPGGGLDGLQNRVVGVGGTLQLDSPSGGPTAVEVTVPCAF